MLRIRPIGLFLAAILLAGCNGTNFGLLAGPRGDVILVSEECDSFPVSVIRIVDSDAVPEKTVWQATANPPVRFMSLVLNRLDQRWATTAELPTDVPDWLTLEVVFDDSVTQAYWYWPAKFRTDKVHLFGTEFRDLDEFCGTKTLRNPAQSKE
jgi:hypothetical protein